MKLSDLRPSPYNPRKIAPRAAQGLSRSIEDFGDISGITWNKRTGNLVSGHQRLESLKAQGVKLVGKTLRLPNGDAFPVRVVDWDEAKEQRANVSANNPAIAGEFTDALAPLLETIHTDIGDDEFAALRLDALGDALPGVSAVEASQAGDESAGTDPSIRGLTYSIVVDLETEKEQGILLGELEGRGFSCRLLMF